MKNLESTKLMINAIEEVSNNRLVKYIIGIGGIWHTILSAYPDKFELLSEKMFTGPSGGESYRFYQYKVKDNPNSLPIVIMKSKNMYLPKQKDQVRVMREFLELPNQ